MNVKAAALLLCIAATQFLPSTVAHETLGVDEKNSATTARKDQDPTPNQHVPRVEDTTAAAVNSHEDDDDSSPSSNVVVPGDDEDVDLGGFIEADIPIRDAQELPRLNLRASASGGYVEEEATEEDEAVDEKGYDKIEVGVTPRYEFMSSHEVMTTSNPCANASYYENGGEQWNDENRAQPDPSLGYTCEGLGYCEDANGYSYDFVSFSNIASQAACAAKCASITENSGFRRGCYYDIDKDCVCLYNTEKAPYVPGGYTRNGYDGVYGGGTGEIAGTDGWAGAVCFSFQEKCSICDIFSTGVNEDGSVLGANLPDPHYNLFYQDGLPMHMSVVADGWPISPNGPWVANDATSKWIGPNTYQAKGKGGDYYYKTFFTIPCNVDVSTISIEGEWAADNSGTILLNGEETSATVGREDFRKLQSFHITSGFKIGKNTIDFKVYNVHYGPTSLRVKNIVGTYTKGDDSCPCSGV